MCFLQLCKTSNNTKSHLLLCKMKLHRMDSHATLQTCMQNEPELTFVIFTAAYNIKSSELDAMAVPLLFFYFIEMTVTILDAKSALCTVQIVRMHTHSTLTVFDRCQCACIALDNILFHSAPYRFITHSYVNYGT